MDVRKDLKELANSILDSYELRVKTVNVLMGQTYDFLKTYQRELEEMIVLLRDNLAKGESLRKRDFDRMISDILERHRNKEEEAEQSFMHFLKQEKEMIGRLRNIIECGNRSSPEDIELMKEDILKRQKEREKAVVRTLKQFQMEQEELKVLLKNLLSKGKDVRIKDFKTMLNLLRAQQSDRDEELVRVLDDFEVVRSRVRTQWEAVSRVSN